VLVITGKGRNMLPDEFSKARRRKAKEHVENAIRYWPNKLPDNHPDAALLSCLKSTASLCDSPVDPVKAMSRAAAGTSSEDRADAAAKTFRELAEPKSDIVM
jgi:hypothetical protein